jgi:chitosanase
MDYWMIVSALVSTLLTPIAAKAPAGDPTLWRSFITRETEEMTPEQRRRADQIISVFENETQEMQYGYTEELGDGRGLTAGRAGFTTATGDLVLVVQRYVDRAPDSPLKHYLPRLLELAEAEDGSTDGLEGLSEAWEEAADDPLFRTVQDEISDELYYQQAVKWRKKLNIRTPLGLLFLYDTIIQHGEGDDPDGLPALIQRTTERAGGTPKSGIKEEDWLDLFLKERRETLAHAQDEASREAWAESIGRCDALGRLAREGNYDLHGPITLEPFGTSFTIE